MDIYEFLRLQRLREEIPGTPEWVRKMTSGGPSEVREDKRSEAQQKADETERERQHCEHEEEYYHDLVKRMPSHDPDNCPRCNGHDYRGAF